MLSILGNDFCSACIRGARFPDLSVHPLISTCLRPNSPPHSCDLTPSSLQYMGFSFHSTLWSVLSSREASHIITHFELNRCQFIGHPGHTDWPAGEQVMFTLQHFHKQCYQFKSITPASQFCHQACRNSSAKFGKDQDWSTASKVTRENTKSLDE